MRIAAEKIQNKDYMEQYEKTDAHYRDGFLQCPICGRQAEVEKNFNAGRSLRIIDGGSTITDEDFEINDGSDVGWWPVGATCWKKWLKMKEEMKKS